ncbi:MAG: protease [Clostridiales bacterium]|jgi:protease I|nr:protease [Clostridiales bacterium]
MALEGKKLVMLAANDYEDLELWYPVIRLQEAGAQVIVAAAKPGTVMSKHGYPVEATVAFADVKTDQVDGVLVPGGWAPDGIRRHKEALDIVRQMNRSGKLVAAICHAGWVLASAEILQGRTMTCVSAIKDDVIHAGAKYIDQPVVVDGNLITSRTPADLPQYMKAIVEFLSN